MVQISMSSECKQGRHDECPAVRRVPAGHFGGWRCSCSCHTEHALTQEEMDALLAPAATQEQNERSRQRILDKNAGLLEEPLYRCTVCGEIGVVGRCCGSETRIPLNDAAREELYIIDKHVEPFEIEVDALRRENKQLSYELHHYRARLKVEEWSAVRGWRCAAVGWCVAVAFGIVLCMVMFD